MKLLRSACGALSFVTLSLAAAVGCSSHGARAPGADAATMSGAAGGGTAGVGAGSAGAAVAGANGAAGAAGQGAAGATAPVDASAADVAENSSDADAGPAGVGCGSPGTLCWDFEEGKIPDGWTTYRNEFTGTLLVDNTRAHGGTYALHAKDFQGGNEADQGGPKKTIRYTLPAGFGPVLWGRAFIYTTPARAASHAGFFNARYPRPAATDTSFAALDWYETATYMGTYMSIWHPPEPPGYPEDVQVTTTPIVLDAWACLEWEFDGQNGTAAEAADPRMWLDGVELAWPDTFIYPDGAARPKHEKAQNFTVLEAGIYLYQGLTTVTNWWIDDLAVGPQRIGCN
ncbi:MAG TPA: hypothetical protein VH560_02150 [Polyangia bacterium]|nr:hypothetical protein [Polyangia bacterium]